jgi:hypothetical protein
MPRQQRFTVRLADREIDLIEKFANENHVVKSVALRRLLEVGLAWGNRGELPDVGQNTNAPRQQLSDYPI